MKLLEVQEGETVRGSIKKWILVRQFNLNHID